MKLLFKFIVVFFLSLPLLALERFDEVDNGLDDFLKGNSHLKVVDEKLVDVPYERGKSIFRGRAKYLPKLSYCVVHKDRKIKVSRKSMYGYKHSTYTDLSFNLYNCDEDDSLIFDELPFKDFLKVLYYLDVKYTLNLKKE